MKLAIIGTRGIPNRYGGFEQMAEHLSAGLAKRNHDVYVYNSHNHPYQRRTWNDVNIIHCYDPERKIGTAGQFIYDLNCILDARKRNFDAILLLGYTSSSVWGLLYPKDAVIISNMDGLEFKRSKYSRPVRRFLMYAEKLAVRFSNYLIADSLEIQSHLKRKYRVRSEYIAYGADIHHNEEAGLLENYQVAPYEYCLVMARMEPENNIDTVLTGFQQSNSNKKMLVIGDIANKYGQLLCKKFKHDARIQFIGAIYDAQQLHTLKIFSHLYFHGHSVGGTNPSLLEAMASKALIAAHNNPFNKAILQEDASYFSHPADVKNIVEETIRGTGEEAMIANNFQKIQQQFSWNRIIDLYESYILRCIAEYKNVKVPSNAGKLIIEK